MSTSNESDWESTAVQNLTRFRASGTYFARFRVGKKLIWKSLKTTVFSVAKQRLADMIREHRAKVESVTAFANGKMNVGDAAEVYLRKVRANVSLKPRSKDYREMMIDFIRRSWPALMETDGRKVTERDCESWLMRYQQQNAPTVVNNSIEALRAVFDEAISTRGRFNNPAAELSRVKVRAKRLELRNATYGEIISQGFLHQHPDQFWNGGLALPRAGIALQLWGVYNLRVFHRRCSCARSFRTSSGPFFVVARNIGSQATINNLPRRAPPRFGIRTAGRIAPPAR